MNIEVIDKPSPELMDFFEQRLNDFNVARWEVKAKIPLVLQIKDKIGNITAGVSAKTFGYWLLIDNLWVSEELRGKDIGSKLLARLEETAQQRGCKFALLDTLNFQARPFYEKFGYTVEWTQENYPKQGCKYFMVKKF